MNASEILIDLAQDRYPIGTVVKSALTGTEFTSSGSFIVNEDRSIYSVAKQGAFSVYDARMKKWAEVVEQYKKGAPAFCMVSHDGVNIDLYDKCFFVDKDDMKPVETTMKVGIREAVEIGENVVFSTREAAEKWIFEQKPKSILEGEVLIEVNKEREFKLLMDHYESKGWVWCDGDAPLSYGSDIVTFPSLIAYRDRFFVGGSPLDKIPFSDFAAEVGIKVPVVVMTSEDGVPLYEGDKLFEVNKMWNSEKWYLVNADNGKGYWIVRQKSEKWNLGEKDGYVSKAFSSKEAAEEWILEANKPKHKEVKIFNGGTARVYTDAITLNRIKIKPSDLEDMLHAYQQLQQQSDKNASE